MATAPTPTGQIKINTAAGPKDKFPYMALIVRTASAVNRVAGLAIHECIEPARQYEVLRQKHLASGAVGKQSAAMKQLQDTFYKECGVPSDGQGKLLRKEHAFSSAKVAFNLAHILVRYGLDQQVEDWSKETYPSLRARKAAWEKANPKTASVPATDPNAPPVVEGGADNKVREVECSTDSIVEGIATLLPFITLKGGQFSLPGKYDHEAAQGVFNRLKMVFDEAARQIADSKTSTKRSLLTLAEESAKRLAKTA